MARPSTSVPGAVESTIPRNRLKPYPLPVPISSLTVAGRGLSENEGRKGPGGDASLILVRGLPASLEALPLFGTWTPPSLTVSNRKS